MLILKFRAVIKAKALNLKVWKKAEEEKIKKTIKYAKFKSFAKTKSYALKTGKMAEKSKNAKEK